MKKIIFLNILFFLLLLFIFMIAALGLGYASNKRFGTDAGILYLLIVTLHLFFNYFLMHRKGHVGAKILYISAAILAVYMLIIFH